MPCLLKRQDAAAAALEMGMIGSRCATARTVVEHHQLGKVIQQLVYFRIMRGYLLGFMPPKWDGIMFGQDGERIDEQFKILVNRLRHLLFRSVFLAEETRAGGQRFVVNLGTR